MKYLEVAFVFTFAALGIALFVANDSGVASFVTVRDVPTGDGAPAGPIDLKLSQKLDAIHDDIKIRPDQEEAWRRFAGEMTTLDGLTQTYERRLASGETIDVSGERARHALIYGSAMNDVQASLSARQALTLGRLAGDLAKSAVCRGLASR